MTRVYGTLGDRLFSRLAADPETGCLLWTGMLNHDGYGLIRIGDKIRKVHRVVWELFEGPIPDGLEIDHVKARGCVNRHCASMAHLELVTHAENKRRALKTHCKRGHELTPENVYAYGDNKRKCRPCARARAKAQKEFLRVRLTPRELLAAQRRTALRLQRQRAEKAGAS